MLKAILGPFNVHYLAYSVLRLKKHIMCTLFVFQIKQALCSKSPPKPSKRSRKNKKDEKKDKKTLPDVVPSEAEDYDDVLPFPPRREHTTMVIK